MRHLRAVDLLLWTIGACGDRLSAVERPPSRPQVSVKRCQQLIPAIAAACGLLFTGCAQTRTTAATTPEAQQQTTFQQAPPELRLADHKAWINRLMATPPQDQGIQQVAAVAGGMTTLPVPTPASFNACALQIDQQHQLAWLLCNGEQHGPWKLDNPDVVHLLKSVQPVSTAQLP